MKRLVLSSFLSHLLSLAMGGPPAGIFADPGGCRERVSINPSLSGPGKVNYTNIPKGL